MENKDQKIEEILKQEAGRIKAPESILKATLEKADLKGVTRRGLSYKYQTSDKGRFKLIENSFMKFNLKIAVPVLVVVVVIAVLLVGQSGTTPELADNVPAPEIALPEADGDVDTTVDAILAMVENEAAIIAADDIDLDLVEAELQTLDDLTNTYDEL